MLERHARPSRHSRGSRHRADTLRIGGHRSNRGELGLSWWMDLRDEVSGTEGTIWLNHWLAGFEMFTAAGQGGYVAEKAEQNTGWLFPVGDEADELGYTDMFTDMFAAMDAGHASARSKRWEPIHIEGWQAAATEKIRDDSPPHDRRAGIDQGGGHAGWQDEAAPSQPSDRARHPAGRLTREAIRHLQGRDRGVSCLNRASQPRRATRRR